MSAKTKLSQVDDPRQECMEVKSAFKSKREAQKVAEILLDERLIASGQIYKIESRYIWKGKREKTREFCLEMTTKKACFDRIEKVIKENHSYECPEIIATDVAKISDDFCRWIVENTTN